MRSIVLGVSLLSLAACQTATTPEVTRTTPLGSVPLLSADGLGNCSVQLTSVPEPFLVVDPKDDYYGATSDRMSEALDGYADAVGRLSAAAHRSAGAQAQLRDAILSWATADAMQWPRNWNSGEDSGPATVYFTIHTLVPVIVAYGEHRALFAADEQLVIEDWMRRLINRTGNNARMASWSVDNKGYLWGSAAMAFGIITEDDRFIQRGQRSYETAIRNMRSDGSLPNDSGRGGSAIHYTAKAIASLVLTAELAAGHGIDLYGYEARGRTIHTAIRYLLDATDNPSIIAGYAAEETGASFRGFDANNQRLVWMRNADASWGVYYANRFEGTELATRLSQTSSFVRNPEDIVDVPTAGIARCFSG